LDLSIAHAVLLLGFTVVGDGGLLHDGLKFQSSVFVSVTQHSLTSFVVPLVSVACSLNTILEEGVNQTLRHGGLLSNIAGVLLGVSGRRLLLVQ
jgi:hypothetical protein